MAVCSASENKLKEVLLVKMYREQFGERLWLYKKRFLEDCLENLLDYSAA